MTRLLSVVILLSLSAVPVLAEWYSVNVRRVEQDLYQDTNTRIYIQTRYCYEYVYYEDAVLKYEPYSYDNKLVFDGGSSCDVVKVFK